MKEGNELLIKRQKLIQLADWSEYGWDLVREYECDELAEDSDDEKKIAKAEKVAEKRLAKKKSNLQGGSRSRQVAPRSDWRYGPRLPAVSRLPQTQLWMPKNSNSLGGPSNLGLRKPIGPCFSCGEFGHLKVTCSKNKVVSNKYPLKVPVVHVEYDGSCSASACSGAAVDCYSVDTFSVCSFDSCETAAVSEVSSASGNRLSVDTFFEDCELTAVPNRVWEVDNEVPCVKGRLRSKVDFWIKAVHYSTHHQ